MFVDLDGGLGGFGEFDAGVIVDHRAGVDEPLHGGDGVAADVVLLLLPDLRDSEVAAGRNGELCCFDVGDGGLFECVLVGDVDDRFDGDFDSAAASGGAGYSPRLSPRAACGG
ncbi:hypothetical protein G3I59_09220 [Amycolatopsis rubida]|uniref:Uncharacterized protein n=1 Tax=Amycolatopsis rubida TaxID=112413 RepID=A0ABX0BNT9_9PSEU|nr:MULTISPECIES: hypothetical protein [Amycolatopsis]MYW90784.1 hypothetical protein [Amycolatopsis rubida]NEC55767.1 hypothetical protein [Amycolatopsis rubida]